jgi:hypothetical protein
MRKMLVVAVAYLLLAIAGLLFVEGIYSIGRWQKADRSITYDAYLAMNRLLGGKAPAPASAGALPVASRDQIEALIPQMLEAGIGMGNVPYKELVTDRAAINMKDAEGCLVPKPSIRKTTAYVRTGEYDRFDPPSMFFDRDAKLQPAIENFVATYGVGVANFTSNADSERTTLPEVRASRKILIAGDSVAVGAMIDDSETIASHLQRTTRDVTYVNLGVNGAEAKDIICRLRKASVRYHGAIDGLVYVYSENDFKPDEPFGRPREVIDWLKDFATREGVRDVTVVFAPYIYNIIPHLTRFNGSRGAQHGEYSVESDELKKQVLAAGFHYLSIAEMARQEALASGTDFAVFSLFVDHAHLSNRGTAVLVEKLRNPDSQR